LFKKRRIQNAAKTIFIHKLISLEQKMKEIKEMRKQILQFKEDVVNDKC